MAAYSGEDALLHIRQGAVTALRALRRSRVVKLGLNPSRFATDH